MKMQMQQGRWQTVGDTHEHPLDRILLGAAELSVAGEDKNQRIMVYSSSSDPICLLPYADVDTVDYTNMKVCVFVTQSYPTLCNPMDCSPPGSSIHRTLQARKLEWIAIPFSKGSLWPRDQTQVSCIAVRFFSVWTKLPSQIKVGHVQAVEGLNRTTTKKLITDSP